MQPLLHCEQKTLDTECVSLLAPVRIWLCWAAADLWLNRSSVDVDDGTCTMTQVFVFIVCCDDRATVMPGMSMLCKLWYQRVYMDRSGRTALHWCWTLQCEQWEQYNLCFHLAWVKHFFLAKNLNLASSVFACLGICLEIIQCDWLSRAIKGGPIRKSELTAWCIFNLNEELFHCTLKCCAQVMKDLNFMIQHLHLYSSHCKFA